MEVSNKKQMLKIFKIGKSKIIRSVGEIMILMNKQSQKSKFNNNRNVVINKIHSQRINKINKCNKIRLKLMYKVVILH